MSVGLRLRNIIDVVFVALAFAVGLQLLRVFVTGLVFYLREVREFDSMAVGGVAFGVFGTAFLAPLALRTLGPRGFLLAALAVMGVARLAEQSVTTPPIDLIISGVGVVAFLPVVPLAMAMLNTNSTTGRSLWRIGLLFGLALDTAIKGGLGTVDASWQAGAWVGLIGVGVALALLALTHRETLRHSAEVHVLPTTRSALPLLAVGPFLFLELLLFQNVAQQTALIEWSQPAVLAWILLANVIGIAMAVIVTGRHTPWPVIVAAGLVLAAAVGAEYSGWQAAGSLLVGHLLAVTLVSRAIDGRPMPADAWGLSALWTGAVGLLLFLGLSFLYYAGYDLDLGIERSYLPLAAVALIGLPVLAAWRTQAPVLEWNPLAIALPLILFISPLALFIAWSPQHSGGPEGHPLRVMSYNIHQGFGTDGNLSMEALALAMEAESPDIIALQEVSRGWMINGSVDTLEWLSQRLDMPYVWGPAADSTWGNAVLTRLPITGVEHHQMPNNDELLMDRGFLWMELDTGLDTRLRVIATHFHHPTNDGHLRLPQSFAVLKRWNGEPRTVLIGDFNGLPGSPEIEALTQAGFKDAFVEAGVPGPGFTFASDDLYERIDYVFVTPDLTARDYSAQVSQASDHLPVAVTVDVAP